MSQPDPIEITLILPESEACDLIAGKVPHTVMVACISGLKAMHETPADFVSKPRKRRAQARTEAA